MLAQRRDLVVGKRRVAAIDVADNIGVGLKHHIFIDQARAGDRWASGVNRALDAVFAGPRYHLPRCLAVFNAAESYFAENLDARCGQFFEIIFDHSVLDDRSAGMNFYSSRTEGVKGALGENSHGLETDNIFGAARRMHLAGRDHCRHPAVHVTVDPAELILPRCPITAHGVNMAVDQAGRNRRAFSIDGDRCPGGINIFQFADSGDTSVGHDNGVGVEDGIREISAEQETNIANDQLRLACRFRRFVLRHNSLSAADLLRTRWPLVYK